MKYTLIPNDAFDKLAKLSGKTLYLYVLLRSQLRFKPKTKIIVSDIVTLPYNKAEKMGLQRMAFLRAAKQLVEMQLVEIAKKGTFGGRRPTKYRILDC